MPPEPTRIAIVDVQYDGDSANAACVVAEGWSAHVSVEAVAVRCESIAPYRPGRFFERELPCVLRALGAVSSDFGVIVVDGYVFLDDAGAPGLGAHLYESLARTVPVVGIAKKRFRGSAFAVPVLRGESEQPLYVTAIGIDPTHAAALVRGMHGEHRIPTLVRTVDHLARGLPDAPSIGSKTKGTE